MLRVFAGLGCTACQYYRKIADPMDAGGRRASINVAAARHTAAEAGMAFDSIHGVFGDTIDPTSPDAAHRAACLDVYEDEGRLAVELAGPGAMVVVHPAAINPGRREVEPTAAAWEGRERLARLMDVAGGLARRGERVGAVYLVENLPFSCAGGHDPAALGEVVRRVGSPAVRMCFDMGHAHITVGTPACPGAGTVAEAFTQCADVVGYLHVHDNDGAADSHMAPGEGGINWEEWAKALRMSGCGATRMLELFHAPEELEARAAAGLAKSLRRWLGVGEAAGGG